MSENAFFYQKAFLQFQMGFAKSSQTTKGIHIRQYSRAFVFEQNHNRNVFVSADCAMMSQLVKKQVGICRPRLGHYVFDICFVVKTIPVVCEKARVTYFG